MHRSLVMRPLIGAFASTRTLGWSHRCECVHSKTNWIRFWTWAQRRRDACVVVCARRRFGVFVCSCVRCSCVSGIAFGRRTHEPRTVLFGGARLRHWQLKACLCLHIHSSFVAAATISVALSPIHSHPSNQNIYLFVSFSRIARSVHTMSMPLNQDMSSLNAALTTVGTHISCDPTYRIHCDMQLHRGDTTETWTTTTNRVR